MKTVEQKLRQIIREEIQKTLNEETTYTKSKIEQLDNRSSKLFKELVPNSGKADTVEGEMLRAINRIIYRYFNDGDYYFKGYGKETVSPSVRWLINSSPLKQYLKDIFSAARKGVSTRYNQFTESDGYQNKIYEALEIILDYIEEKNGQYIPNDSHDSR